MRRSDTVSTDGSDAEHDLSGVRDDRAAVEGYRYSENVQCWQCGTAALNRRGSSRDRTAPPIKSRAHTGATRYYYVAVVRQRAAVQRENAFGNGRGATDSQRAIVRETSSVDEQCILCSD